MQITKFVLTHFRNHKMVVYDFKKTNLITGVNGAGKTNILEAIYLLAVGKSFRADVESEMVAYGEKAAFVVAEMIDAYGDTKKLQLTLTDGMAGSGRKKFSVNDIPRRQIDAVGLLKAVLFSPTDIELLTGTPSKKRKYLDFVISQGDREYHRSLLAYEKALRQRNRLLDLIREGQAKRTQLFFWDQVLIKNGDYISYARQAYLANLANEKHEAIYDRSVISPERLAQYEQAELAAGSTLVGPHRDDFLVNYEGRDVAKFGSRGEQRMAILWLKMGEIGYLSVEEKLPILLLDDVFSELDVKHRDEVLKIVSEQKRRGGQIFMTSAEEGSEVRIHSDTLIEL